MFSSGYYSHISTLADVHEHVQVRSDIIMNVHEHVQDLVRSDIIMNVHEHVQVRSDIIMNVHEHAGEVRYNHERARTCR